MHIKQVVISRFRSYKDQPEVTAFSPHHNVVVGRNGSGKSNFFDAIRFVLLNVRFANLRQEERQQLLHEGAGANVAHAFVEIYFDNSDGRFPVDSEEVVLRRTIGVKKDEFFLNRKHISKNDVTNLLESAGFSRSNPYYIVQQGKVNSLCLMKDRERLELLKEVAGTRVYEERRAESSNIMQETLREREKIREVISYIETRLSELEAEKEELGEYQAVDRSKRALEYTLYDKELRRAREGLEDVAAAKDEAAFTSSELHKQLQALHDRIRSVEKELKGHAGELRAGEREKGLVEATRSADIKRRTQLELEVRDLEDRVSGDGRRRAHLTENLQQLEGDIKSTQRKLKKKHADFERVRVADDAIEERLSNCKTQVEHLYSKQGRSSQFKSEEERDAYLTEEAGQLRAAVLQKKEVGESMEAEIEQLHASVQEEKAQLVDSERAVTARLAQVERVSAQLREVNDKQQELQEARKEAWRAERDVDQELAALNERQTKAEREMQSSMPRALQRGLQAVKDIAQEERLVGVRGPLIELFTVKDEKFRTAVEVAAGNALFHVVVDTDDVAATLMQRLERHKLGRVTFLPLNRLRIHDVQYPTGDVLPMIERLHFDPSVRKAMMQVFGKKLLCKNLEDAAKYSESANMDAVTLNGDEVNRRGGLHGGFVDPRRSRLEAMAAVDEARAGLSELKAEHEKVKRTVQDVDQRMTAVMGERAKLEAQRGNLRETNARLAAEIRSGKKAVQKFEERIGQKTEILSKIHRGLQELEGKLRVCEGELGTELLSSLSEEEREELRNLNAEVKSLEERATASAAALAEARGERNALENELSNNLERRRDEIVAELAPASGGVSTAEREEKLEACRIDLSEAESKLELSSEQLRNADVALEQHAGRVRALGEELEELKGQDARCAEKVAKTDKSMEKLLNKRALLLQRRDENMEKIRELGSLPQAELVEFKALSLKAVMTQLHTANERLKKFAHVNKKALDQYVSFSEQREAFLQRKKELDTGAEAIEELIDALDRQKDEAILRTFKGVSSHFKQVFSELVPNGTGRLIMVTNIDEQQRAAAAAAEAAAEQGEEEEKEGSNADVDASIASAGASSTGGPGRHSSVSDFTGVSCKVSFTGGGEAYLMQQLSGGQKALVALALIFAIQRCDPAPFYLFDEIDQALDSTHRAAVAALIQKQANSDANPAQFITSTFRPELVAVADRWFAITHQNKVSRMIDHSREDSLRFIRDIMTEEEAVGNKAAGAAEGGGSGAATTTGAGESARKKSSVGGGRRKKRSRGPEVEVEEED